jgi:hypothetical protein
MLDATFIEKLASEIRNRKPEVVEVDDLSYLLVPGADGAWAMVTDLPRPEQLPAALMLGTLAGLASYVTENRDSLDRKTLVAIVQGHDSVSLRGPIVGHFKERAEYVKVQLGHLAGNEGFRFGSFMDSEEFVIALQARFVYTPALAEVLKLVGNIKDESVRQVSDDGVTQTVTARVGAVLSQEVQVPNPVTLAPYRTFREIEQPESRFVLRMRRGGEGQKPTCALFEADGAAWKLAAVERIAAWLKEKLAGTDVVVIA